MLCEVVSLCHIDDCGVGAHGIFAGGLCHGNDRATRVCREVKVGNIWCGASKDDPAFVLLGEDAGHAKG